MYRLSMILQNNLDFFVLVDLNNNCINNDANVCAFCENAK